MRNRKGFTLIEILLVVVIIGIMLAVIVPRAWRANIDSKYGLVRQNCSELASFGMQWAEIQLLAQDESNSWATMDDYLATLATGATAWANFSAVWVADTGNSSNWNKLGFAVGPIVVNGRVMPNAITTEVAPEACVEQIIAPEKIPRNPFNETSVFQIANDPITAGTPVVGAIACATVLDSQGGGDDWHYYAFLFQGTDNLTNALNDDASFHAGQGVNSVNAQRNGIFMSRIRPGGL